MPKPLDPQAPIRMYLGFWYSLVTTVCLCPFSVHRQLKWDCCGNTLPSVTPERVTISGKNTYGKPLNE
jgi:hypothetical protein